MEKLTQPRFPQIYQISYLLNFEIYSFFFLTFESFLKLGYVLQLTYALL